MMIIFKNKVGRYGNPPYSPDLNPCDYNCFGPLKHEIKKNRYDNWDLFSDALNNEIHKGLQRGLFQGVQMLPDRWSRVIEEEGNYI